MAKPRRKPTKSPMTEGRTGLQRDPQGEWHEISLAHPCNMRHGTTVRIRRNAKAPNDTKIVYPTH